MQGLLYAEGSESNKLRHYLDGRAAAELLEDWFFLDASARLTHQQTTLSKGGGLGDPVGIGNTTSVGSYTLSPYLKHRFGSIATVEARIARDGVFISDATASDAETTRYSLKATSGMAHYPLYWDVSYTKEDHDNSNAAVADTSSQHAALNARYQLNRKFGLRAQAGMEKHDFTGASAAVRDYSYVGAGASYSPSRRVYMDVLYNTSDNGDFLSGSMTLRPTLRTNINASTSQRAYGRSHSLALTHRARRSNWSLRYVDEMTTSQQQFLNFVGSLVVYNCPTGFETLPPGVPPSDPANCTVDQIQNLFNQTQVDSTYVSKNLTGSVSYNLRHNTWTLSLYTNNRDFLSGTATGTSDTTNGLQASWSLRPSPRTTFTLTGGMSQIEQSATGRDDDLWSLGLVATRKFQPKLSGSLEVRHQERQSNQAGEDYSENSVAARINMTF